MHSTKLISTQGLLHKFLGIHTATTIDIIHLWAQPTAFLLTVITQLI